MFSYSPSLTDDISKVRFHTGDVDVEAHYVEDETIAALLAQYSNNINKVVIACIQFIISQLSSPNFSVDWLDVSLEEARKGYEALLQQKLNEEASGSVGGTFSTATLVKHAHRQDSYEPNSDGSFNLLS